MKERRNLNDNIISKIKEVTELAAISGHEAPVRAYLREKLTPHVDEVVTDGLGGIFGIKHSESCGCTARLGRFSHGMKLVFMGQRNKAQMVTFRVVGNRWLESLWWLVANVSNS